MEENCYQRDLKLEDRQELGEQIRFCEQNEIFLTRDEIERSLWERPPDKRPQGAPGAGARTGVGAGTEVGGGQGSRRTQLLEDIEEDLNRVPSPSRSPSRLPSQEVKKSKGSMDGDHGHDRVSSLKKKKRGGSISKLLPPTATASGAAAGHESPGGPGKWQGQGPGQGRLQKSKTTSSLMERRGSSSSSSSLESTIPKSPSIDSISSSIGGRGKGLQLQQGQDGSGGHGEGRNDEAYPSSVIPFPSIASPSTAAPAAPAAPSHAPPTGIRIFHQTFNGTKPRHSPPRHGSHGHGGESYYQRRLVENATQQEFVQKILAYLRIHPHSKRLCLGLLHLNRRKHFFKKLLEQSLWWKDLCHFTPPKWINQICHPYPQQQGKGHGQGLGHKHESGNGAHGPGHGPGLGSGLGSGLGHRSETDRRLKLVLLRSNRQYLCEFHDLWGSLHLTLRTDYGNAFRKGTEIHLKISSDMILKSLSSQPLLLASYLCDVMTNSYSLDLLRHLLDCLDHRYLPSSSGTSSATARSCLEIESHLPRISFTSNHRLTSSSSSCPPSSCPPSSYRGPLYSLHRFVSHVYCFIQVYESSSTSASSSSQQDLMIILSSPTNGQFPLQSLPSSTAPITLSFPSHLLKAWLLKLSNLSSSSSPSPSSSDPARILRMNHASYLDELVHALLDSITLSSSIRLQTYRQQVASSSSASASVLGLHQKKAVTGLQQCSSWTDPSQDSQKTRPDLGLPHNLLQIRNFSVFEIPFSENSRNIPQEDSLDNLEDIDPGDRNGDEGDGVGSLEKSLVSEFDDLMGAIMGSDHSHSTSSSSRLDWRQQLELSLMKLVHLYNQWITDHHPHPPPGARAGAGVGSLISPIDSQLCDALAQALQRFQQIPEWKFKNKILIQQWQQWQWQHWSSSSSVGAPPPHHHPHHHQILVYDGFFPATDPRHHQSHHLPTQQHQQQQQRDLFGSFATAATAPPAATSASAAATDFLVFPRRHTLQPPSPHTSSHTSPIPPPQFSGESYWRVMMSTNEQKSHVVIELNETTVEDPLARTNISIQEQKLMFQEDDHSKQASRVMIQSLMLREEAEQRFYSPVIPDHYLILRIQAQENVQKSKEEFRKIPGKMLELIDGLFDKLSLCNYKIALESLQISSSAEEGDKDGENGRKLVDGKKTGKSGKLVFQINSENAMEMCRKTPNLSSLSLLRSPSSSSATVTTAVIGGPASAEREVCVPGGVGTGVGVEAGAGAGTIPTNSFEQFHDHEIISLQFQTLFTSLHHEIFSCGHGHGGGCTHHPTISSIITNAIPIKAYPGPSPIFHPKTDLPYGSFSSTYTVQKVHSLASSSSHHPYPSSSSPSSFRDPKAWSRYRPLRAWETGPLSQFDSSFLRRAQKGSKPKIIKLSSGSSSSSSSSPSSAYHLMISSPHVGPYDLCAIHAYCPQTQDKYVISFQSQTTLPKVFSSDLENSQKFPELKMGNEEEDGEEEESGNESDQPQEEDSEGEREKIGIERFCAERLVWRSLVHGITKAICVHAEELLDQSLQKLEAQIAYECTQWLTPPPPLAPPLAPAATAAPQESIPSTYTPSSLSSSSAIATLTADRENLYKVYGPNILHRNLSSMRLTRGGEGEDEDESLVSSTITRSTLPRSSLHTAVAPSPAGPVGVVIFSVFCPADEDQLPIPYPHLRPSDWQRQCAYHLQYSNSSSPPPPPQQRIETFPVFIYSNPSSVGRPGDVLATGSEKFLVWNEKIPDFLEEYSQQTGWRKPGLEYLKHQRRMKKYSQLNRRQRSSQGQGPRGQGQGSQILPRERHGCGVAVEGDVMLLFRYGESDFQQFMRWCGERFQRRQERLQQEAQQMTERWELEKKKYLNWRSDLLEIVKKEILKPFEKYFFERSGVPVPAVAMGTGEEWKGEGERDGSMGSSSSSSQQLSYSISSFHLRALLLFCQQIMTLSSSSTEEAQDAQEIIEDCLQLMNESYMTSPDDTLRCAGFQSYHSWSSLSPSPSPSTLEFREIFHEKYFNFQHDPLPAPAPAPSAASASAAAHPLVLLIALYLTHCTSCTLSLNQCPVPCCGGIRGMAKISLEEKEPPPSSCPRPGPCPFSDARLWASAVREALEYFIKGNKFHFEGLVVPLPASHQFGRVLFEEEDASAKEACSGGARQDPLSLPPLSLEPPSSFPSLASSVSSLPWMKILRDGQLFRYLHRRLQFPHVTSLLSPQEIFEAAGGHDHDADESQLSHASAGRGGTGAGTETGGLDSHFLDMFTSKYLPNLDPFSAELQQQQEEEGQGQGDSSIAEDEGEDGHHLSTVDRELISLMEGEKWNRQETSRTTTTTSKVLEASSSDLEVTHAPVSLAPPPLVIPTRLLKKMLGGFVKNSQVPEEMFDPCPSSNLAHPLRKGDSVSSRGVDEEEEERETHVRIHRLMSEKMFDWLLRHLHIARPSNNYQLSISLLQSSCCSSSCAAFPLPHSSSVAAAAATAPHHPSPSLTEISSSPFLPFHYFPPHPAAGGAEGGAAGGAGVAPEDPGIEIMRNVHPPLDLEHSFYSLPAHPGDDDLLGRGGGWEESDHSLLLFDRLYESGPIVLPDGSYLMLHILHGILHGYNPEISLDSGCPDLGKRYLPANVLEDLQDGLTFHLYDLQSGITKIISLQGMKLQHLLRRYDLVEEDYPAIAKTILKFSSELFVVHRLSTGLCLEISIHISYPSLSSSRPSLPPLLSSSSHDLLSSNINTATNTSNNINTATNTSNNINTATNTSNNINTATISDNSGVACHPSGWRYEPVDSQNGIFIPKKNEMRTVAKSIERLLELEQQEEEEEQGHASSSSKPHGKSSLPSFPLCF